MPIFQPYFPCVIYAIEDLGSSNLTQLNRLTRLLDKCLKILSDRTCANAFSDLKILTSDQIYEYFCLTRAFKYYDIGFGFYFKNHTYNTKFVANQNLVHPNLRTSQILKKIL